MAFTATQKDQIRQYLGFPSAFYDLNSRFESVMDTVGADATAQAGVEAILTKLASVETAIQSGGTNAEARGTLKAITGDVEWYPVDSESAEFIMPAVRYGRVLINRLAARFGFTRDELPSDYFGIGGSGSGEMALG